VSIDCDEAVPIMAQVAGTAGRQQMQPTEQARIGVTELSDHLRAELLFVAAGDDGDLDAFQQRTQLRGDPRIDRGFRRSESVVEIKSDKAGSDSQDASSSRAIEVDMKRAAPEGGPTAIGRGDRI